LWLRDADGKSRVGLSVEKEGPTLRLRDADGKQRAELCVAKDNMKEGPTLRLSDADEKARVALYAEDEQTALVVWDKTGQVRGRLGEAKGKSIR
jgi:hypothetical protein